MAMNPTVSELKPRAKPGPKAWEDRAAAVRVRDLREARGLSQEQLAAEIKLMAAREGWNKSAGPAGIDAFTLRRIEKDGHVPHIGKRLGIALYFGVQMKSIWETENRYPKAAA